MDVVGRGRGGGSKGRGGWGGGDFKRVEGRYGGVSFQKTTPRNFVCEVCAVFSVTRDTPISMIQCEEIISHFQEEKNLYREMHHNYRINLQFINKDILFLSQIRI